MITKNFEGLEVSYDDSPEAQKKIFDAFIQFCIENEIFHAESAQGDNIHIEGPQFLAQLAGETFKVKYGND